MTQSRGQLVHAGVLPQLLWGAIHAQHSSHTAGNGNPVQSAPRPLTNPRCTFPSSAPETAKKEVLHPRSDCHMPTLCGGPAPGRTHGASSLAIPCQNGQWQALRAVPLSRTGSKGCQSASHGISPAAFLLRERKEGNTADPTRGGLRDWPGRKIGRIPQG